MPRKRELPPTTPRNNGHARPEKLCAATQKIICDNIAKGHPISYACACAGISQKTYYNWLRNAESDESLKIYKDFAAAIFKALATSEKNLLSKINKSKDWKAAKWLLTQRFPDTYKEQPVELAINEPLSIAIHLISPKKDKA